MSTVELARNKGRDGVVLLLDEAQLVRDEPRRASLARAAGRLAASVVRPLSAALDVTIDGDHASTGTDAELAVAVHELACDATRLRVGIGGPPALLEATAALQDLTCQLVADDEERLLARRDEFAALQEPLSPSIQSAPDGPYLVTNVTRITDRLGVPLSPLAQSALCRCGASETKPWCDGSHSVIGFRAEKAPDRVPDRLDTYEGQHITVTDNRGTCAHSGFCTDRAPTAFRTATEPFVAPSGARVDEIVRAARDCPSGALGYTLDERDPDGLVDQHREPAIEVGFLEPFLALSWAFPVTLHTREVAGSKPAAPIKPANSWVWQVPR